MPQQAALYAVLRQQCQRLVSGNHDSFRIADFLNDEELRLAYLFIYTMPGVPYLFAGDELGQKTNRNLTSKEGGYQRTGTRIPMVFDNTENRGFSKCKDVSKLYLPIDNETVSAMEQLEDNLGYMEDFKPLNEEEYALIKKAVTAINSTITVPCTGCAYCVDGCPMNIAIPKYFSLYNADLQEVEEKGWTPQGEYYNNLTKTFGKASDCVECGQCEGVCPQHLSIIQYLKDVAGHFEK